MRTTRSLVNSHSFLRLRFSAIRRTPGHERLPAGRASVAVPRGLDGSDETARRDMTLAEAGELSAPILKMDKVLDV